MIKKRRGRKSKYHSDVKERFDEIAEMCKLGATDKEIAQNLGVNKSTFCEYKTKYPELNEFLKECRKTPILQIKAALFKRATGFTYLEKTTITDPEGDVTIKEVEKQALPDPASAMILLKHWAREEGWTNDPAILKLKKEELEIKKQQLEKDNW